MKKFLPTSLRQAQCKLLGVDKKRLALSEQSESKGFTLIELLVVIAILAVLGIIGLAILTGTQSKARDAKRKEDIAAMASAMEANYTPGTGYLVPMAASWFADGTMPVNPNPNGTNYATNTPTTADYMFCALLENSTGNATDLAGTGLG